MINRYAARTISTASGTWPRNMLDTLRIGEKVTVTYDEVMYGTMLARNIKKAGPTALPNAP